MKEYQGAHERGFTEREREGIEEGRYWANWANASGMTPGGLAIGGGIFAGAGTGLILWVTISSLSPWIIAGCAVAGLGFGMLLMALIVAASAHQNRKYSRKP